MARHLIVIGSLAGPLGAVAKSLSERGARVEHAERAGNAIDVIRTYRTITHALCDIGFDIAGFRNALQAEGLEVTIIACAPDVRPGVATQAIRAGAHDVVALAIPRDTVEALLAASDGVSHQLIAEDPLTLDIVSRASKVAPSEASVLILGESGTGKEVFARHIHRQSRRASGPFVAVNCAAIPDTLLESELFGYEKGAFSGAVTRRVGKFESAHRGTLLLDEIGEIDIRLQAKLLRAIQEREIDRVGGNGPIKIDVRILATTNRDLRADVRAGVFREDLYYRINVISFELPPLRNRAGDLVPLAEFFARKYAEVNGVPNRELGARAIATLRSRAWPGNVRELENAMHRSVLTSTGSCLELEDETIHGETDAAASPARLQQGLVGSRLDEVERNLILETLEHTHGNRTHAATMLGISIRALRNKIREYAVMGMSVPPPQSTAAA